MTTVYIDGDACPVKEEVFRAVERRRDSRRNTALSLGADPRRGKDHACGRRLHSALSCSALPAPTGPSEVWRRSLRVVVVANAHMRTPPGVEIVVVKEGMDAADDWIAEHSGNGDVVVTGDIELASRALKTGAAAIDHRGKEFMDDNIGSAMAMRDLMKNVRQMTGQEMGPKPMAERDRKKFMKEFSALLERLGKQAAPR